MMFLTDSLLQLLLVSMVSSTVIIVIVSAASYLLRHHSAAVRHRVWTLSLLAVLLLPLGLFILPQFGPAWSSTPAPGPVAGKAVNEFSRPDQNFEVPAKKEKFEQVVTVDENVTHEMSQNRTPIFQSNSGTVEAKSREESNFAPEANSLAPWNKFSAKIFLHAVFCIWLVGVVIGLLQLVRCQVVAWRLTRSAVPVLDESTQAESEAIQKTLGIGRQLPLLCSPDAAVPLTLGAFRPVIVLPAGFGHWDRNRLQLVLAHEMAHVRRRDVLLQWIARFACVIYWCNPLVWLANWRIRVERERACDDVVLMDFQDQPTQYAGQLVNVAAALANRKVPSICGVAMASHSQLEQRVRAILDPKLRRTRVSRTMGRTLGIATVAIVVALCLLSPSSNRNPGISVANAVAEESVDDKLDESKATRDLTLVSGMVVDEQEQAVPGTKVKASLLGGEIIEITAVTDADGKFMLEVPTKRVAGLSIHAQGPTGTLGYTKLPWEIEFGKPVTASKIELLEPREVKVHVLATNNTPASNIPVVVHSDFFTIARGTTAADGRAVLSVPQQATLQFVLADGGSNGVDYSLFRDPEAPKSDPYQLAHDHDQKISMKLSPTRSLTICAVDGAGNPIEGASVSPWYIELPKKGGDANLGALWRTETDANGKATLKSMPLEHQRKLTIWVRKSGYMAEERLWVDVKEAEPEVTTKLLPLVPVEGRVLNHDGTPAAGIKVMASGDSIRADTQRRETTTDADGSFRIDVEPQSYFMFLAGDDEKWASAIEARIVLNQPVKDVELLLEPARRVYGRLTTAGTDEPIANQYMTLYQKEGKRYYYYDLPVDKQLPNPTDTNKAIVPRIIKSMRSKADGTFEFFTGPGEFYLHGPAGMKAPEFEVAGDSVELNVEAPRPVTGKLKGRVVNASAPEQGTAELVVFGYPETHDGNFLRATTENDGSFEDAVSRVPQLVGVFNKHRSLGAVKRMEAGATELLLTMQPTAVMAGTLLLSGSDLPAANREIGAAIDIKFEGGNSMPAFKRSATTDEQGRFSIAGIIPDREYRLTVVADRDNDGRARAWESVGAVTAKKAGRFDAGEFKLSPTYRPLTVREQIDRAFENQDKLEQRLAQRLADAKLSHQQILLFVSDAESTDTREFFEARYDHSRQNNALQTSLASFFTIVVDSQQAEFLNKHRLSVPEPRSATFAILDLSGECVVEWNSSELQKDGNLDRDRLNALLEERILKLADAKDQLTEALTKAGKENKRVLVQISGPSCAPCILLSRFLDSQSELLKKDYVYLKLDRRMPRADETISRLRPNKEGGIPWMVILDAKGKALATSDAEHGNIGYPNSPASRLHFEQMIRTTRQRLTNEEVVSLLAPLEK